MQNDMSSTIVAKSDQLNSDDLISGPITIKITKVEIREAGEQRVSLFYEGDQGKPYKPGKSMCRVLVANWGPDANKYVGRWLTLYRDPTVKWAGMDVGGIRISHLSDIAAPMVMALTATRGSKKVFEVKPLVIPGVMSPDEIAALKTLGEQEAAKGVEPLKVWWGKLGGIKQNQLGAPFLDALKAIAAKSAGAPGAASELPPQTNSATS